MQKLSSLLINIIDFTYTPFSKFLSKELYRYGVCGVMNMMLDWVLYFIVYNFILQHQMLNLGFVTLSSHIASLVIVFPITLLTGFWLNKYVTFTQSSLRGINQLMRYMIIVALNLALNYLGLKLFVDICGIYPTPSKMLVTVVCVTVSYLGQKYFTFRK